MHYVPSVFCHCRLGGRKGIRPDWPVKNGGGGAGYSDGVAPSPMVGVSASVNFPHHHRHHKRFTALFRDHPGEPVPEENFRTLWCKGRLTKADTSTIRMGATPFGLVTSVHLNHPPYFLQAGCPSCRPTNSVKAPKATSTFGLGRRC